MRCDPRELLQLAIRTRQFLGLPLQYFLGLLAFRDVLCNTDHPLNLAVLVAHHRARERHGHVAAVLGDYAGIDSANDVIQLRLLEQGQNVDALLKQVASRPANQLMAFVPQQADGRLVDTLNGSVGIDHHQRLGHRFEDVVDV